MDDLLLNLDREGPESLGSQIRHQLLGAIRSGRLRKGVRLPSTRSLADKLGVSRPLVVEAYAQLAAEGYLAMRQGARPVVAAGEAMPPPVSLVPKAAEEPIRFDLRPAIPDLGLFPRKAWLHSLRIAVNRIPSSELGYGDLQGSPDLRSTVADYLGRVRGAIASPDRMFITSGFAEGRALTAIALHSIGIRRLGVEDPGYSEWSAVDKAGLERLPLPVDAHGIQTDQLIASRAQAVFLTPAHQFPVGGILSAERRQHLVQWLHECEGYALEDDYDAEFRYDQAPIGALQGLAPDRVIYAGTVSKTLAPALRLGWLIVPLQLVDLMKSELRRWSEGPPRIDQEALADFIDSGAYDRHLRRMRRFYRQRRDLLVSLLGDALPTLRIEGAAAGLHVTLRLPEGLDDGGVVAELSKRGVAVEGTSRYALSPNSPARLFLGYGRAPESALRIAVKALEEVLERLGARR